MRVLIAALGTCIATTAFADCLEGMRDATPGEIQYHKRVSAALKEALPAPPTNWTLATYVNSDLWGAYVPTPGTAGTWYAWVEGIDGSAPTVHPVAFTVT